MAPSKPFVAPSHRLVAGLLGCALLAGCPAPADVAARHELADQVPHQLLVRFQPQATEAQSAALRERYGAEATAGTLSGLERWTVTGDVASIRRELASNPLIRYAEPNYLRELQGFSPDELQPGATYTWYTALPEAGGQPRTDPVNQWYLGSARGIDAPKAWDWFSAQHPDLIPGEGALVAVVDTGIDVTHPDLVSRIATDSQGQIRQIDLVGWGTDHRDLNGHGTHVAGLIAAAANAQGLVGVAPGAALLPVKVLPYSGLAVDDFTLASGIVKATEAGVDLINFSVGGPSPSQVLADAIAQALAAGVTVLCAAGNYGQPVIYPAACEGVIAVGATGGGAGAPWSIPSYSCFGPELDVVAPGGDRPGDTPEVGILSTLPTYGNLTTESDHHLRYGSLAGTSMATPLVTGVAALLVSDARARGVRLTPQQIRMRLCATARPLTGEVFDLHSGYGIVDPLRALQWSGPQGAVP